MRAHFHHMARRKYQIKLSSIGLPSFQGSSCRRIIMSIACPAQKKTATAEPSKDICASFSGLLSPSLHNYTRPLSIKQSSAAKPADSIIWRETDAEAQKRADKDVCAQLIRPKIKSDPDHPPRRPTLSGANRFNPWLLLSSERSSVFRDDWKRTQD